MRRTWGEPSTVNLDMCLTVSRLIQWDPSNTYTLGPLKCVPMREVSSFQAVNNTYFCEVGTWSGVLIRGVSSFQGCPLRGVPLYTFASSTISLVPRPTHKGRGSGYTSPISWNAN